MFKKTIWPVIAGVLFIVAASSLVDAVLHATGVYPPMGEPLDHKLSLLAISYRIAIGVAGGWLTARLAAEAPMKHAMILGYVGVVLGLLGVLATWNKGMAPNWYPVALAVLAIPQCWAGGKIFEARQARA